MGSPRKGGNSDCLLDRALEGARSGGAVVEKIVLNDLKFRPCQNCGGCDQTGACILRDGMRLIYEKVGECDGIIISSPVFFANVSAQVKMMIDRFQCVWVKKNILEKAAPPKKARKGVLLSVSSAGKPEHFENSRKAVRVFFAAIGVDYYGEIFRSCVEKKGDIKKDKAALDRAFELGAALAGAIV